jgi:Uma2 family endonuclease
VAWWHDILLFDLAVFLKLYLRQHPLGTLAGATSRVKIASDKGREPDIVFVPKDQYRFVGLNLFTGIPALVIEILSPTSVLIDRVKKYAEYAELGIPEYWIVDFPNRCIEVHRLVARPDGSRGYELADTCRGDAIFRPALFPGLEVPLSELWPTEFEPGDAADDSSGNGQA